MLDNQQNDTQYVVKIISNQNPIQIKLPILPSRGQAQHSQVITIDSAGFTVRKNIGPIDTNFINAQTDAVKLLFANGYGCFNQQGRQTQVLQILQADIPYKGTDVWTQKWGLIGNTDPFMWTTGHDLQFGFTDVDQTPLDFGSTALNTYYTLIVKVIIV